MEEKTTQLLAYILKHHKSSVTSLIKLAYLIDLVSLKKGNSQVSNFQYIRYNFGPFDSRIYSYIEDMTNKGLITPIPEFTPAGNEFISYELNDDADINFEAINDGEKSSIDEVLAQLSGYGAKALTEVAYKTKPMVALGATLGGNEHLGEVLNLHA